MWEIGQLVRITRQPPDQIGQCVGIRGFIKELHENGDLTLQAVDILGKQTSCGRIHSQFVELERSKKWLDCVVFDKKKAFHAKDRIYGNVRMLSPDGIEMCYISNEKMEWYLTRDLAEKVGDNTIKLKFTPNGLGDADRPFYLIPRKNHCVVCGFENNLTKHHVIPDRFRKHLPDHIKLNSWHDILAVCVACHKTYNSYETLYVKKLEERYNVNLTGLQDFALRNRAIRQARSIVTNAVGPQQLINVHRNIAEYLGKEIVTERELVELAKQPYVRAWEYYRDFVRKIEDTQEFIIGWRQHFVDTMEPKFLPPHWDVNFNEDGKNERD